MLKIVYLTKRRDSCYWLRALNPASILNTRGHKVQDEVLELFQHCPSCRHSTEFHWGDRSPGKCFKCGNTIVSQEAKKAWHDNIDRLIEESDIVCFQRPTSAESIELIRHAKDRGKKTTQVCDDHYLDIPLSNTGYQYYTSRRPHIEQTLREVDALDVTVPYLIEAYKDYNDWIEVLPNCHDKEVIDATPEMPEVKIVDRTGQRVTAEEYEEAKSGRKVLFWGGSPTHEIDLKLLLTSIRRISRSEDVIFVFAGYAHRAILEIVPKERLFLFELVTNNAYFSMLKSVGADIGMAPAAPHTFNRGKSNLRVMEYCFFRWFPVASNFETYAGSCPAALFPENTDYDWYHSLRDAIHMSPEETNSRVQQNRLYAEEHYDISKQIYRWENFYERLLAGEKK